VHIRRIGFNLIDVVWLNLSFASGHLNPPGGFYSV
jgi:hypothetical protein